MIVQSPRGFNLRGRFHAPAWCERRKRTLAFAVDCCWRAGKVNRITMTGLVVLCLGIAAAWLLPVALIARTGQWLALIYVPFMGFALTTFFVLPPLLFLLPRLLVWDGVIDGREIDITRFMNPADLVGVPIAQVARFNGSRMRLVTTGGTPFDGRLGQPAVTSRSFYRAVNKSALRRMAVLKGTPWRDVELGLLVVTILVSLFIGLLAMSE